MWHADYGGYPADEFLAQLHPRLPALKASLGRDTFTTDTPFGTLCREWATRLGLPRETVVAVGAFDAHVGAVGAGIRPHRSVKVMGTSLRRARRPERERAGEAGARNLWAGGRLGGSGRHRLRGGPIGVRRRLCLVQETARLAP